MNGAGNAPECPTRGAATAARLWLGEFPLGQRTILLSAEQGSATRYSSCAMRRSWRAPGQRSFSKCILNSKRCSAHVDGVASCHARGEALPAYDYYCPLGSLPLAFKTEPATIPADIPYLSADDASVAKWRPAIEALAGKRVALAWAGNARHPNDRNRSIDLKLLEPLFALEGVSFISIQRELRDGDAALLARHYNVTHVGDNLADMADTAAIVALADLTIAVDTSVVHLAGAMGRDAWVLVPFSPDWRWTLSGQRSPWYPQARLFRQPAPGDWPSVIAAARDALLRVTKAKPTDQAATRTARDRSRRLRMRLEPVARRALGTADLGIAHLFGDFTAQLRGILVAAHGRDVEPLVRLHQINRYARACGENHAKTETIFGVRWLGAP